MQLRREGWSVNLQASGEDPPGGQPALRAEAVVPSADDADRYEWRVWPNLARHLVPMAVNQPGPPTSLTYISAKSSFIWR